MASPENTNLTVISVAVMMSRESAPSSGAVSGERVRELIGHPTNVIQPGDGQAFVTSAQGQFELFLLQGNKIDFRDLSGDISRASGRMPEIISGFMKELGSPTLDSYGVNFIVELEERNPPSWLAGTFLSPDLKGRIGGKLLSSDHIGITIQQPDSVVTLRFTDGGGQRVNVNYNASKQVKAVPDPDLFGQELRGRHSALFEIIDSLRSQT